MPNARTKAWLAFRREHPNVNEMSPAQIWNLGFDAGWYTRIQRETELTWDLIPKEEPHNPSPIHYLAPDDTPAPAQKDDRAG